MSIELEAILFPPAEIEDFNDTIQNLELYIIKSFGSYFSWSNRTAENVGIDSQIDHALANTIFMDRFLDTVVHYLPKGLSDHTPLKISLEGSIGGNRPFKFFNVLCDHPHFMRQVEMAWNKTVKLEGLGGILMRLVNVKHALKDLHSLESNGVQGKIEEARRNLYDIQEALVCDPGDRELLMKEKMLQNLLRKWLCTEERILAQKARAVLGG